MAENQTESQLSRLTACKERVADILAGEFVRIEGWDPNYLLTKKGRKLSRVNVMATVVSLYRENGTIGIDDGTATITLRYFGNAGFPEGIDIGDIVVVVGRVRKFGDEIFIAPEIVKKLSNPKWLEVRKLELMRQDMEQEQQGSLDEDGQDSPIEEEGNAPDNADDSAKGHDDDSPAQKVYMLIKSLDAGKGADADEVLERSGVGQEIFDKVVKSMLEQGEIFQPKPGRLKILV